MYTVIYNLKQLNQISQAYLNIKEFNPQVLQRLELIESAAILLNPAKRMQTASLI